MQFHRREAKAAREARSASCRIMEWLADVIARKRAAAEFTRYPTVAKMRKQQLSRLGCPREFWSTWTSRLRRAVWWNKNEEASDYSKPRSTPRRTNRKNTDQLLGATRTSRRESMRPALVALCGFAPRGTENSRGIRGRGGQMRVWTRRESNWPEAVCSGSEFLRRRSFLPTRRN